MVQHDDWLMSQIKGIANMVGKIFRLEISHLDLGSVEDEEGNTLDGAVYLENLLAAEHFSAANRFIKSKLKTLNYHEYGLLVEDYLAYLSALDEKVLARHGLNSDKLVALKSDLMVFEW